MSAYEVPQPILNSPFEEPKEHLHIVEGEQPERRHGRHPPTYFYRDSKAKPDTEARRVVGTATATELKLVTKRGTSQPPSTWTRTKPSRH